MPIAYLTPGVYREEVSPPPSAELFTGVPGFVGFGATTGEGPVRLDDPRDFATRITVPTGMSYLSSAVRGFYENGGIRCYVAVTSATDRDTGLIDAIASLTTIEDVDLIVVPDAMLLRDSTGMPDTGTIVRIQQAALSHCMAAGTRFAILDAMPGCSPEMVAAQRRALVSGLAEPVGGAIYYPWIRDNQGQLLPPSGHIAGVYARTDDAAGVFRAPAGGMITGALDLELGLDDATQGTLNNSGINCLRAFAGRGVRVWGARTLSNEPEWRYVSVRRLFLTLSRWIDANLGWTLFEPNDPSTWARIERALTSYLSGLWQAGALQGMTADQAFFVKCDGETNPSDGRDVGRLVVEVGLAPSSPAEFVVVRLTVQPDTPP